MLRSKLFVEHTRLTRNLLVVSWEAGISIVGRFPFNQNVRAEVRKFLGVEWNDGSGKSRSIPLAKRVSRSLKWRMLDHCCSY